MRIRKFLVTSLLSVAATGVAMATAHGEAATAQDPITINGSNHGVVYSTSLSDDHKGVTTRLSAGRFDLTPEGDAVTVTAPDGTMIERWPTSFEVSGYHVQLDPELTADGSALTLRSSAPGRFVSDVGAFNQALTRDAWPQLQQQQPQVKDIGLLGGVFGGIAGAALGAIVFTMIGALFLVVGAIPGFLIGAVIGAVLGGMAGLVFL